MIKLHYIITEEILNHNPIKEDHQSSFNMEEFKGLKSFKARIEYCEKHLQKLAAGSSRIVYKIDDEKVLKLAKNQKGLKQNETEINFSNDYYVADIFAETYDYHPDNLWVEMEFCKKINGGRFESLVGVPFKVFLDALAYDMYQNHPNHINLRKEERNQPSKPDFDYDENEFISKLFTVIVSYDLPVGDFSRISTYGENSNNEIVVIDYGLTRDIYDNYYKKW